MLLALMFVFMIVGMIIGRPYFYALYFPNYTLNILAAISTTGLIYLICRSLKNSKRLLVLSKIGKLSILLLCVHSIDFMLSGTNTMIYKVFMMEGRIANILFDLLLIIVPIMGMCILSEIKYIRKIFNIK